MNKEKIEEILLKHSPYVFFGNAVKTELFGETVKHLTTLIQEERKEAVEGFITDFSNKCLHDSINESYNYYLEEIPNIVSNFVEQYLESEEK
jgi:hypothetical protein